MYAAIHNVTAIHHTFYILYSSLIFPSIRHSHVRESCLRISVSRHTAESWDARTRSCSYLQLHPIVVRLSRVRTLTRLETVEAPSENANHQSLSELSSDAIIKIIDSTFTRQHRVRTTDGQYGEHLCCQSTEQENKTITTHNNNKTKSTITARESRQASQLEQAKRAECNELASVKITHQGYNG